MDTGSARPSDARRAALQLSVQHITVSNFFPIERYFDAADKAYEGFQTTLQDPSKLDEAYVFGKRYCLFCLEMIPTHNYYRTPRSKVPREKHTKQVNQVLTQLEDVVARMDAEEIQKQKERAEMERREAEERKQIETRRYQELQQRVLRQQQFSNQTSTDNGSSIESSALSKLERLRVDLQVKQEGTGRVNSSNQVEYPRIKRDPSGEKPTESLPPPLLPPTENGSALPPPSYNQAVATQRNGTYRPEAVMHNRIDLGDNERPAKRRERTPMAQLQKMYQNEYVSYRNAGRISTQPLGTYQGRSSSSINGCTVISALVAAAHLTPGMTPVSGAEVDSIIDQKCVPILRKIRSKLDLGNHALIIPSDVHDQLVDDGILHQKYFVGAAGGSVMDPEHMGNFLSLLVHGEDNKSVLCKSSATFFFHEHVISIIKTPVGGQQVEFELIDSLQSMAHNGRGAGTRYLCKDLNAMLVLLRWYTSRKFSPSDCAKIDREEWDDMTADTDPRVFQGFVWALPP